MEAHHTRGVPEPAASRVDIEQAESTSAHSTTAAAFRAAIERGDVAAVLGTLAPEVVFNSPIVHRPYAGRAAVAPLLAAVMEVFADFRYTRAFTAPDGHALQFRTRIGEREVEGIDLLIFDAAGLVSEFTVMVRPYSAATALREAMAARLGQP